MTSFSLAELDAAPPLDLDPSIWTANLAALRESDAALAELVAGTDLKPDWRPAVALDNSPSYRIERGGAPPAWLGNTAIPARRAATLVAEFECGESNATLPALAAGAELTLLLERLPRHRAVFVFAEDLAHLAAVLRLHNLSHDISIGRCILLPPGREPAALDRLLQQHPGLLPPGNILCLPGAAAERIRQIQRICMETAERCGRSRAERIAELQRAYADAELPRKPDRLAIIALSTDNAAHRAAGRLAAGWRALGREAVCRTVAGPRDAHLLAHCAALADFRPGLTICVNHPRANLPLPARETACEWRLDEDARAGRTGDGGGASPATALAATPALLETLERERGRSAAAPLPFYFACDAEASHAAQTGDAIALVADLPNDDPAVCGVIQPTHVMIWESARELARRNWETSTVARPHTLLKQAERAAGVDLSDPGLRGRMLRLIARTLIPAAFLERILQTLRQESTPLSLIGTGWTRLGEQTATVTTAESVSAYASASGAFEPLAWIFAGRPDPLHPDLPTAAATGRPLLLHAPGGESPAPLLRDVLSQDQHYVLFSAASDLRKHLASMRERPQRWTDLGRRTREHILANHTYAHRLRRLIAALNPTP